MTDAGAAETTAMSTADEPNRHASSPTATKPKRKLGTRDGLFQRITGGGSTTPMRRASGTEKRLRRITRPHD
jgi:hypothetical protein